MGRNDNGGERAGYWTAVSALSAPIIKSLIGAAISQAVMGPVQLSTLSYAKTCFSEARGLTGDRGRRGKELDGDTQSNGFRHRAVREHEREIGTKKRDIESYNGRASEQ